MPLNPTAQLQIPQFLFFGAQKPSSPLFIITFYPKLSKFSFFNPKIYIKLSRCPPTFTKYIVNPTTSQNFSKTHFQPQNFHKITFQHLKISKFAQKPFRPQECIYNIILFQNKMLSKYIRWSRTPFPFITLNTNGSSLGNPASLARVAWDTQQLENDCEISPCTWESPIILWLNCGVLESHWFEHGPMVITEFVSKQILFLLTNG